MGEASASHLEYRARLSSASGIRSSVEARKHLKGGSAELQDQERANALSTESPARVSPHTAYTPTITAIASISTNNSGRHRIA